MLAEQLKFPVSSSNFPLVSVTGIWSMTLASAREVSGEPRAVPVDRRR